MGSLLESEGEGGAMVLPDLPDHADHLGPGGFDPGCSPVTITMFVQVVAVTLLPAALVFLLLLLNDESCMGEHTNTTWENYANWIIVIIVALMSTLLGISTLFPSLFK
jgi:Mn2+/Fe2+ NRAMP family transporter